MTAASIPAHRVHEVLAAMAWERVPADASLAFHMMAMSQILSDSTLYRELWRRVREYDRPRVVCLCGSTRFWREYQEAQRSETLAGRIVLTVGFFVHAPEGEAEGEQVNIPSQVKARLDQLHLRKIDLSDEILVLNRNNYVGESTRNEIQYAEKTGKLVRYLEPIATAEGEA